MLVLKTDDKHCMVTREVKGVVISMDEYSYKFCCIQNNFDAVVNCLLGRNCTQVKGLDFKQSTNAVGLITQIPFDSLPKVKRIYAITL